MSSLLIYGCDYDDEQNTLQANAFHSYRQIATEFSNIELSYANIAKVFTIGQTHEGRDILALRIHAYTSGIHNAPAVLIVGGQHAREWLTLEIPLQLARHLTSAYDASQDIQRMVEHVAIWIVPLLNPDGHEYSRTTNRFWRKNRRSNDDGSFGVDLNRNYAYAWGGPASSDKPGSAFYQGPAPFSEPETQALQDLLRSYNFQALVDYHSYAQVILYPVENERMRALSETMSAIIAEVHGKTYRANPYEAPLFGGSLVDWANQVIQIDAYMIELRPDTASNTAEYPWLSLRSPFDPPISEITPTWEEHRPALLHLINTYGVDVSPQAQRRHAEPVVERR